MQELNLLLKKYVLSDDELKFNTLTQEMILVPMKNCWTINIEDNNGWRQIDEYTWLRDFHMVWLKISRCIFRQEVHNRTNVHEDSKIWHLLDG